MQAFGVLSGVLIGVVLLLVCVDVIGRNLGFRSISWTVDVTEYSLPLATLLAAPWLLYRNEHVRLDLFSNSLSERWRIRMDRFGALVAALVCFVLAWYGVAAMLNAKTMGSMVMKDLVFPEWWLFAPLPLLFGMLAVESLRRLLALR
jgi:TRAP-type transport system small permease protein